jgi:CHASE3 domain sensor protein
VLALIVGIAVLTLGNGTAALDDATDKRGEARRAVATVTQVETDVLDLEAGVRGFVITGRERFLQPWVTARRRLPGDLARLRRRVRGERGLVTALAHDSSAFLRDDTQPVVDAVRNGRSEPSSEATTAAGEQRVDRLRRTIDRLRGNLDARAAQLSARAADESHAATRLGIGALLGLSGLILVLTVYLLRSLTRSRAAMNARSLELARAQEEADRAKRARSECLSRMSHELRTPLNAVLGFAQLLELDHLSDDQHESVQQIARGGRNLLELIDEVLEVAPPA